MKLEQYLEFDKEIKEKLLAWVINNNSADQRNATIHSYMFDGYFVFIQYSTWTTLFMQMPIEYLNLPISAIQALAAEDYRRNLDKNTKYERLKRKCQETQEFVELQKLGQELNRAPLLTESPLF